ncbi:soluble NSF attachment protein [Cercophora newfieldiana]|uniref:Soluble NSF attachment protein n=1 Tax=Cercophora newfieldiana TaxID=92897 RepID=A0AA39XS83_9PEZI|nr:soluble NSF attachment protein [Cercophora newfieldiana]
MALDPRALVQKADKVLSSVGGGFSFFSSGKEDKYQSAADLYVQAGNAFKLEKHNKEAGAAFEKAASIHRDKLSEPDDAANLMIDAFKAYRKDSPEDAVRCIEAAIRQYTSKGNFRRAASHKEAQGELLEEIGDRKRALDCYDNAAQWYEGDNAVALANKLWLKVADIAALEGDYYRAIENYEKVADASLGNNLMRYSVKEYFLKAGICVLATKDIVSTRRNLEKYREKDPGFGSQREYQLLVDLTEAVEEGNQEAFTDKLYAFDQMSRLDKWKTEILVRIKNQIEEADNEFS